MHIRSLKKTLTLTAWLLINLTMATPVLARPSLEKILIKKGILTRQDLKKIDAGDALEDLLLEKGVISQDDWNNIKTEQTASTNITKQEIASSEIKPEKGYAIKTGTNGLEVKSNDGDFKFGVGGRVQADGAFFFPNEPYGNGVEIRRVRLKGYGTIWKDWKYKAEIDFAEEAELTDGWIAYTGFKGFTLKAGNQKIPFSLQSETSSNWQVFQERALTDAFLDTSELGRRRLGGTASWYGGDHFYVRTGIFGEGVNDDSNFNQSWGTATRVVWDPILGEDKLLHIGGAMYYRDLSKADANSGLRFSYRPEAHISGARLVDTGTIAGAEDLIMAGAEVSGIWGPLHAQGEFVDVTVNRDGVSDLHYDGWYTQIGYFLTGESRNYDYKNSKFKRVKPHSVVGNGGYGAWEVAARFSYIDLNGAGLEGGRERNLTIGLNWWANANILFRLNYVNAYAYPSSFRTLGATNQTVNVIEGRAQVVF